MRKIAFDMLPEEFEATCQKAVAHMDGKELVSEETSGRIEFKSLRGIAGERLSLDEIRSERLNICKKQRKT